MHTSPLAHEIEAARGRAGLSVAEFAARCRLTRQGLEKILAAGTCSGRALARLRRLGGVRITGPLVETLDPAA
jgi:hypothetical protein